MKQFIGTKVLQAKPMTRAEYNTYRGWQLPANEDGADDGYLVEYAPDGHPNDARHLGYISWSPKAVFETAYRDTNNGTFGDALVLLEMGHRVARAGWNGKGLWLSMTPGRLVAANEFWSASNSQFAVQNGGKVWVRPYITIKDADNCIVPWHPSQTDVLATDWSIVE